MFGRVIIWGAMSLAITVFLFGAAALLSSGAEAQIAQGLTDTGEARARLTRAQREAREASALAEQYSEQARVADRTAERSAREAAALAARIQQAEAEIVASETRLALITDQQRVLDARLAERQAPIVRLTAALQNMARRPLALSALRPGSLKETVYVRAVLETTVPRIRARTASLRGEVARGRELAASAQTAISDLRADEASLQERRNAMSALEARQRVESERVRGAAMRENDRALALAEQARDLDELVGELDSAGKLRRELAALAGPIIRPARPDASQVMGDAGPSPAPSSTAPPASLRLPVYGRTLRGFGSTGSNGVISNGVTLAPIPGAQVVSPASGRIAFAGPYQGYGQVVIIEHANGWTSLVTGLATLSASAGDRVVGGGPLGSAPAKEPAITLELRRDGSPVNPLQYMD